MKKILICNLLSLLTFFSALFAQTPKTLLWRISGNGLPQSSYLYGTMHLTDERLFRFGDSVYTAIQQTQGYAMEVNPDELAVYIINKTFDALASKKALEDMLDKDVYNRYSKSLSRKFKKPASEITAQDIQNARNGWMTEYFQKGGMPTVVDGYLYMLAKKQAKWVGGIEDITDQTSLLEASVDESDLAQLTADDLSDGKKYIEKMISIYQAQDLDRLDEMSQDMKKRDAILVRRNIKMAHRMDSLSAIRPMFFAVGAAHLPGDGGVISLLRKAGFTVDPVFSAKQIPAKQYTFQEIPASWSELKETRSGYSVSMPGKANKYTMFGMIDFYYQFDITNLSFYGIYSVHIPAGEGDSLVEEIIRKSLQVDKTPKTVRQLSVDGGTGREFEQTTPQGSIRLQVFVKQEMVFLMIVSGVKKSSLYSPNADKYFSSFHIIEPDTDVQNGMLFTDSFGTARFYSPIPIEPNDNLIKQTSPQWKFSANMGMDRRTGAIVMAISKKTTGSNYVTSDEAILQEIRKNAGKQLKDTVERRINIGGIPGIEITGRQVTNPRIFMHSASWVRGNVHFSLIALGDSAVLQTAPYRNLFKSVTFVPYSTPDWQTRSDSAGRVSFWAPATVVGRENDVYAADTFSATGYNVRLDTLSIYTTAANDSVLLNRYYTDPDSSQVFNNNTGFAGGQYFMERIARTKGSFIVSRHRLSRQGNTLISSFVSGDSSIIFNQSANRFFNSIKLLNTPDELSLASPKAERLLRDLEKGDSTAKEAAYASLDTTVITRKDKSLLEDYLFRELLPANSYDTLSYNRKIGSLLFSYDTAGAIALIKKKSGEHTSQTNSKLCLTLLSKIATKESYRVLFDNLALQTGDSDFASGLVYELRDSLPLLKLFQEDFSKLLQHSTTAPLAAALYLRLLDNNLITVDEILANQDALLKMAEHYLPFSNKASDYEMHYIGRIPELLARTPSQRAVAMARKFLETKDQAFKMAFVTYLFNHNISVDTKYLRQLAASKAYRIDLYDVLEKNKKTKLFPAEYLTQVHFAEADLYTVAIEEADSVNLKLMGKRTSIVNGKKYQFYLYETRLWYDGEPESHLGVAGAYDIAGKQLKPVPAFTTLYWQENFNAKKMNDQFKKWILQLEEALAEELTISSE
ncbi:TraB/GumN family protein [Flavihumibacter petaseus]|uniref:TraB/GumN family protein n=1 Tax=Flavihumibacter petaseus NBRC 106054 TaxID=1220578 RepID=A0A0E9N473_9BACT|nr:TraB/GumN family protein [Flavihumibacter petaseus]GAO44588.1 hypothetical protein FPE01S_03_06260 [Flavihumibacter petaseus NBRC 106054]